MQELKIYNGFGITPTNTFVSAGTDYYVPNIDINDTEKIKLAFEAFQKSYNKTYDELVAINELFLKVTYREQKIYNTLINILHLYLALYNKELNNLKEHDEEKAVKMFINEYLVFDKNNTPGVKLKLNDTLFINSGIKIVLPHGYAGVYLNKSGKGNAGFDVRAQVVDEDYSGYVHLSQAYTKDSDMKNIVYCGDKLVQMLILPVLHTTPVEISDYEYNTIMSDSQRGSDGFGSSDVKH